MFEGVRLRLGLWYAGAFVTALVLLGPVLYISFSNQLAVASDVTLRLAAQREAALGLISKGTTVGIKKNFNIPEPLALRDIFYLFLTPDGRLRPSPGNVAQAGLPDRAAAQQAARLQSGVFTTIPVPHQDDIRLFTVPILRSGHVAALVQAGHSLAPLREAQRSLLVFLLELGAAAVGVATLGGLVVTRQAMRPINTAFAVQRAFVADASHELRTPLTLIRTNAEVLLEAQAIPDPEDRALVEDIVAESAHMGRLIADLLILARLDAGALTLIRETVELGDVVNACCRQMARIAEHNEIQLTYHPAEVLLVSVDPGRLEQVLLILLDNAIKYNRPGGTVDVRMRRENTSAVIQVADSGRGISAADLPYIFARFHRGKEVVTTTDGHGLGLAIAEAIVRAHRGTLRVDSTEGQGACFSILLPLSGRGGRSIGEASYDRRPPRRA